ncbi:type IV-A pilus assembly ATPase PilB [candidate division TA06 bacterium]|uniref:protein-secreting ATPase n=1 Tax=candidate division TA06 bacterium TaxID=2250710 RepID=A0A523UN57_UNCT6|nr:MAG: type IV-A pilus assembly ATPase PilB [candidate division TA06 bacterium]
MLVNEGLIDDKQLDEALSEQRATGEKIGSTLTRLGFISEETLVGFLSKQFKAPSVDLSKDSIDPAAIKYVSAEMARRYEVVPIKKRGRILTLAMVNPSDVYAIEDIKFHTGLEVAPVVAAESSIRRILDKFYQIDTELEAVMEEGRGEVMSTMEGEDVELVEFEEEEEDISQLRASGKSAPVTKLVNFLITDAVRQGASDIHIEPYERILRVRFRIDGVLHEVLSPPYRLKGAIISRIKIMATLNIAERRIPQDGRIKVKVGQKMIDLRVSIVPTLYGEKVVMRILDKSALMLDMTDLGFEEEALKVFLKAIELPYGIILVTGPTGSGKSTTLYSALSRLNTPNVHILTVEDPVEYNLRGINQVQVNDEIGLTFAFALRAFLRQSPNIIMVGEIRDSETAEIAVRAALTGHLVLSTIHTNDAPSTINRLIDMGIEPFLVAASVTLIQAQRLVRKICSHCKEPVEPDYRLLEEAGIGREEIEGATIYHGKGCQECGSSGYKGRLAIFEVMPISPKVRQLILERSSNLTMQNAAKQEGMKTLREDVLLKLKHGVTTIEEVIRQTASMEK